MDKHPAKHQLHPVLMLGHPGLRSVCDPVVDFEDPGFVKEGRRLMFVLQQFWAEHGFGRAIAAPQIGVTKRMIAMNLGEGPFLIVNPEIVWESEERFSLWDDCMSFPFLMVRLTRAASLTLSWQDHRGQSQLWDQVDRPRSELLQHEIDHLDGVLAVDHAMDRDALVAREVYEADRDRYDRMVPDQAQDVK